MVEVKIQGAIYDNTLIAPDWNAPKAEWSAFWLKVKSAVEHAAQLELHK